MDGNSRIFLSWQHAASNALINEFVPKASYKWNFNAKSLVVRPPKRALSSVGQSSRLIIDWSQVQVLQGPPFHRMIDPLQTPVSDHAPVSDHERWMRLALREAERAFDLDEVPIGCIIVREGTVIAKGHNLTEQLKDATAHAEIMAITAASAALESRYLTHCTLYVTIEPCPMCAGAIVLSRIPRLVFGAYDSKAGACGTLYNIPEDPRLNHRVQIIPGVLDRECASMVQEYFRRQRNATKSA